MAPVSGHSSADCCRSRASEKGSGPFSLYFRPHVIIASRPEIPPFISENAARRDRRRRRGASLRGAGAAAADGAAQRGRHHGRHAGRGAADRRRESSGGRARVGAHARGAEPRQHRADPQGRHPVRDRAGLQLSPASPRGARAPTGIRSRARASQRARSRDGVARARGPASIERPRVRAGHHARAAARVAASLLDRADDDVSRSPEAARPDAALRRDADRGPRAGAGGGSRSRDSRPGGTAGRCTAFRTASRICLPPRACSRRGARSRTPTQVFDYDSTAVDPAARGRRGAGRQALDRRARRRRSLVSRRGRATRGTPSADRADRRPVRRRRRRPASSGFAVGTETGGSIVSPASTCGVVGLRPTYGRISRYGCMTLRWTLDKVGPITRSVGRCRAGARRAARARWPRRDRARICRSSGTAIATSKGFASATSSASSPAARPRPTSASSRGAHGRCYEAALEVYRRAGATLVPITLPDLPAAALYAILNAEAGAMFDELVAERRHQRARRQGTERARQPAARDALHSGRRIHPRATRPHAAAAADERALRHASTCFSRRRRATA